MKQYVIMVDLQTDTVAYVKHKLASKTGTPTEAQRLSFRGKVLDDGELKRKHGIGNLRDVEYILQAWDARKITVKITSHLLPEVHRCQHAPRYWLASLRPVFGACSASPKTASTSPTRHTHTLMDDHTLNDYNIHYDTTLKLHFRLSLASGRTTRSQPTATGKTTTMTRISTPQTHRRQRSRGWQIRSM